MPLNVETFDTKQERQDRIKVLKKALTPHVCQHTSCVKDEKTGMWRSTYSVTYPPQMATKADLERSIKEPDPLQVDEHAIAAAEGEGMPPVVEDAPLPLATVADEYQSAT